MCDLKKSSRKAGFGGFNFKSRNSIPSAPKKKSKAKSKGFFSSLFGSSKKATKGTARPTGPPPKGPPPRGAAAAEPVYYDVDEECEEPCRVSSYDPSISMEKSSSCAPPVSSQSQGRDDSHSVLSVISLQKASGSWDFTDQLVSLCGASRDALIKGCPKEIAVDTGEGKLLWATALALALLMGKFMNQKDEWEMIAEKGTKWLKKNLPATITFAQLLEMAATAVGVELNPGP